MQGGVHAGVRFRATWGRDTEMVAWEVTKSQQEGAREQAEGGAVQNQQGAQEQQVGKGERESQQKPG